MAIYRLKQKVFAGWARNNVDTSKLTYAGSSNLSVTPGSKPNLPAAPIHPQNIPSNGAANVFNAGERVGKKSVGLFGGLKNTWNKAGVAGKASMGAAAVGGTYLLGKGLGLWGNKKN